MVLVQELFKVVGVRGGQLGVKVCDVCDKVDEIVKFLGIFA